MKRQCGITCIGKKSSPPTDHQALTFQSKIFSLLFLRKHATLKSTHFVWAFPATASTAQEVSMNDHSSRQHIATLSYETFKQQLLADLKEFFPDNTRISIDSFSHNNRFSLDGLTILEPGNNISPTIYLETYFSQLEQGRSFSEVKQQILAYYNEHRFSQSVDTSFFTCLEHVRSQIAYKLVNYAKNRELLEEIPHFAYLDLAIVFYYLVPDNSQGNASILIYNTHLAYWNISKDTLLLFAQQNTPQLLPWRCDSMASLLFPSLGTLSEEEKLETMQLLGNETIPMHVITNDRCYFGACCILYPNALKEISADIGDDLILLPSSIHEFILIPASYADSPDSLRDIVCEVNLTGVAPEEILSDSIYCYDRETDKISLLLS